MLTLLAPDIVQAIMDGRQPAELGVHVLREGFQRCGLINAISYLDRYDRG